MELVESEVLILSKIRVWFVVKTNNPQKHELRF